MMAWPDDTPTADVSQPHRERSNMMGERPDDATSGAGSATSKIRDILERYRLPGFDLNAFIETRRADIDALSRATAVAFAGAQTITEKQAELLKAALGELNEALSSHSAPAGETSAQEVVKKQRELVQNTLGRTLEAMKQMAEAAQRAQSEIFDIALERARTNAEQLRDLFVTPKK
jgi:phasin family protein